MKMSRRALRMEKRHQRKKGNASLQMVSLIDIFTVLVFFLLINSGDVQVNLDTSTLKLPLSVAESKPKEAVVVLVNRSDILVQGRKVATVSEVAVMQGNIIPALKTELDYQAERAARAVKKGEPNDVTIMGDKEIPYALLKKIMLTCSSANYSNISLAVNKRGSKGQ